MAKTYSTPQVTCYGTVDQITQGTGVPPGKCAGATDGQGNTGSPRPHSSCSSSI